jgi:hypothetical protein
LVNKLSYGVVLSTGWLSVCVICLTGLLSAYESAVAFSPNDKLLAMTAMSLGSLAVGAYWCLAWKRKVKKWFPN